MNKKEYKHTEKMFDEMFKRNMEEVGLQFAEKFVEKNERLPTEKEMLEIIKKSEKVVATGFKHWGDCLKDKDRN